MKNPAQKRSPITPAAAIGEPTLHDLNQQAARFSAERSKAHDETVKMCLDIIREREGQDIADMAAHYLPSIISGKRIVTPRVKPVRAPIV